MPANSFNGQSDYGIGMGLRVPHYPRFTNLRNASFQTVEAWLVREGKSMKPASRPVHADVPAAKIDPRSWVDEHGDCLYRYALVRVRTPEVAEDLVQETLLAAVRSQDKFAGRSSERSWLVGILKNKVVDYYRKLGRETSFTDLEFLKDECSHKFVEQ